MKNRGFTIVELLVVIVVIGILAAITIVSYTGISSKAVVSSLQSDLTNASTQLKAFQVINGNFPATNNCSNPESSTNICLKVSGGNTFIYTPASGSSPQAFSLVAKNNNTYYNLTNNTQPTAVTPITEASVSATGTYTLSSDGPYRIYKFTDNGSITTTTPGTAEVLVVGGGGGAGADVGGGGGGGGVLYNSTVSIGAITAYNVTVGSGGSGGNPGSNGGNSVFLTQTAIGGGGGSYYYDCLGRDGGSGGGGNPSGPNTNRGDGLRRGGYGTTNQGFNGGTGGSGASIGGNGGGGAGGLGGIQDGAGSSGGPGLQFSISGTPTWYGGGGGAGSGTAIGLGGIGGGGDGDIRNNNSAGLVQNGAANSGGGGGGDAGWTKVGSGGSGIVIIRYLTP